MFTGYFDTNDEATRARWETMQRNAERRAQAQQTVKAGETQPEPSQGEQ